MKSIFDFMPDDIHSEEFKIARLLFSWAFDNTSSDINMNVEGMKADSIQRNMLPTKPAQALVFWYLLFPKQDETEYYNIVVNKLKFPEHLVFFVNAIAGRLKTLEMIHKNHPEVLKFLLEVEKQTPSSNQFGYMHVESLKWLNSIAPTEVTEMVSVNNSSFFLQACEGGQVETLVWLEQILTTDSISKLIERSNFSIFIKTTNSGSFDVVMWMLANPHCFNYADKYYEFFAEKFIKPFLSLTLLALHKEKTSNTEPENFDISNPIKIKLCFYIVRTIIKLNDRAYDQELQFLLSIPNVKKLAHQEVTEGISNELMRQALSIANIQAIEQLMEIEAVKALTLEQKFYTTKRNVTPNYLILLQWLERNYLEILYSIVTENALTIFTQAYQLMHFETLSWLKVLQPDLFTNLLAQEQHIILSYAFKAGSVQILDWLKSNVRDVEKLKLLIQSIAKNLMDFAAQDGREKVLIWLKELVSEEMFQAIIKTYGANAFYLAARFGHISILKWFKDSVLDEQFKAMIKDGDFRSFRDAYKHNRYEIAKFLLLDIQCLIYAEQNLQQFWDYGVRSIVNDLLISVYREQEAFDGQFDKEDPEKISYYYVITRILIRSNNSIANHQFITWFSTPAIKRLIIQEFIDNDNNELMKIALSNANETAVELLMQIPLIKNLTEKENYYLDKTDDPRLLLGALEYIEKRAPDLFRRVILEKKSIILIEACSSGKILALDWIKSSISQQELQQLLKDNIQDVFVSAVNPGTLVVILWLKNYFGDDLFKQLISTHGYSAFKAAITNKMIVIVQFFREINLGDVDIWVTKDESAILKELMQQGSSEVLFHLMQSPSVFASAFEIATPDQSYIIKEFILVTVKKFMEESYQFGCDQRTKSKAGSSPAKSLQVNSIFPQKKKADTPKKRVSFGLDVTLTTEPYDIKDQQTILLVLDMVRSIIKIGDADLNKQLPFLLDIPSIHGLMQGAKLNEFKSLAENNTEALDHLSACDNSNQKQKGESSSSAVLSI